ELFELVRSYEAPKEAKPLTFRALNKAWTTNELHKRYPDHIRAKRTAHTDGLRLAKHVYPVIGDLPLKAIQLEDAERVMGSLPSNLTASTRRQIAQLL